MDKTLITVAVIGAVAIGGGYVLSGFESNLEVKPSIEVVPEEVSVPTASLSEQRVDQNGIYMKASNGKEITITYDQIRQKYQAERGIDSLKKISTTDWVKQEIVKALGPDMISVEAITFDMDDGQKPITLTTGKQ